MKDMNHIIYTQLQFLIWHFMLFIVKCKGKGTQWNIDKRTSYYYFFGEIDDI